MVARAGGHARVGQPALGGDRGDDRLRAVAAGHRERIGAAIYGPAHERLEVLAGLQLDRLDPARACLRGEREALRLPSARARVVEQHRMAWRRRVRQIHAHGERRTRGRQRHQQPRHRPAGRPKAPPPTRAAPRRRRAPARRRSAPRPALPRVSTRRTRLPRRRPTHRPAGPSRAGTRSPPQRLPAPPRQPPPPARRSPQAAAS